MSKNIILNYELLRQLDPQFVKLIKSVYVFGKYGTEVLIITKEDKVYAFGLNSFGCLGLGHNISVKEPNIVGELCDKQIVNLVSGLQHVLAITKTGSCYSWGGNEFGQLGNRTTVGSNIPKPVKDLGRKFIVDISCGAFHSLALTKNGRVFSWGFNFWGQLGNKDNYNQLIPTKVNGLDSEIVIAIGCGHHSSVALTKNGYVYCWGHNGFGQLGIGTDDRFKNIPMKVRVVSDEVIVNKIVCGQNHCLLLSSLGEIYAFGSNYYGQIGDGSVKNQNSAVKVHDSNKFVDIASCLYSNTSVALCANGRAFIWGKVADEYIVLPRETPIKSLPDLFARYNYVTYKQIYLNKKRSFTEWVISFTNGVKKRLM